MIYLWGMEETITYKKCSKCGEEKPFTYEFFVTEKRNKSGLGSACRVCRYAQNQSYQEKNPDIIKKVKRDWYDRNKDDDRYYSKRNYQTEELRKYFRERRIKLRQEPFFRMKDNISSLLRMSIINQGWSKDSKTQEYLGCDWETFKEHLESQFTEGMSWDNHGEWHYDHIYPVSLAQTEEDMFIFNHYTNFQPLWAKDNLVKSNNVPDGFEEWYEMMKEKVYGN